MLKTILYKRKQKPQQILTLHCNFMATWYAKQEHIITGFCSHWFALKKSQTNLYYLLIYVQKSTKYAHSRGIIKMIKMRLIELKHSIEIERKNSQIDSEKKQGVEFITERWKPMAFKSFCVESTFYWFRVHFYYWRKK